MIKRDWTTLAFGSEPLWAEGFSFADENEYQRALIAALNWYAGAKEGKDKKKWLVQWAARHGYSTSVASAIPDQFCETLGALARIDARNFPLSPKHLEVLRSKALNLFNRFKPVEKDEPTRRKIVVESASDKKMQEAMTLFDNFLDQLLLGNAVELPDVGVKFNTAQQKELIDYYSAQLAEIDQALAGDPDYMEAYSSSRRVLNRLKRGYEAVIESAKGAVIVRRQRKRRITPASKKVTKLLFLDNDAELGVQSIDPTLIINATKLVVFNVKTRKLGIYYSDIGGLEVKGSTLQNFTSRSTCKTVRKPEILVPQFARGTKSRVDVLYSDIRAVPKEMTGRINKDTLLLKAFK